MIIDTSAEQARAAPHRDLTALEISALRRSRDKRFYRLCVLPAMIVTFFVAVLPLALLVGRSFIDEEKGGITLHYYISSFTNAFFMTTLSTTLLISIAVTALSIILAYPMAYVMARRTRLRNVFMPVITVPRMLPFVVIGYAMILLLAPFTGLLNKALIALGILSEPLFILFDWPGLMIAFGYSGVVIAIGMLTGVLMSVDPQLEDAAISLGASRMSAFLKVTLPMTIPGVIAASAIIFTTVVTAYSIPVMLGGRTPYMIAPLIATNLQSLGQWHLAFAQAVIVTVLSLAATFGAQAVLSRHGRT